MYAACLLMLNNLPIPKSKQYGPSYNPSLYIKSIYEFPNASDEIEEAILSFESAVKAAQQQQYRRQNPVPNLTQLQWKLLQYLRQHDKYIIVEADKNLGQCILDCIIYMRASGQW